MQDKGAYQLLFYLYNFCYYDILYIVVDLYCEGCYNMCRNKIDRLIQKIKEDDYMAVLAVPSNRLPVIDKNKTIKFIKESNENKLTKEFLEECKKDSALFRKNF